MNDQQRERLTALVAERPKSVAELREMFALLSQASADRAYSVRNDRGTASYHETRSSVWYEAALLAEELSQVEEG